MGDPTVGILWEIYNNREKIANALKRFRRWISNGTLNVPIFGAGGTGKTTLVKFLIGEKPSTEYQRSLEIKREKLPGKIPCIFLTAHGQEILNIDTQPNWEELYQLLFKGKARIVINVVSGGYNTVPCNYKDNSAVYTPGISRDDYLDSYIRYNRAVEKKAMNEIKTRLIDAKEVKGKIRMITVINKQDLWWSNPDEVIKYYKEGIYDSIIQEIIEHKGKQHFEHHYCPICVVPVNLTTKDEEMLALTTAGYDERIKLEYQKEFAGVLNSLLK
jgi:GTPase SAR1 family protein